MTGFVSKRQAAQAKLDDDTQVYAGRKRGSIALARSLCYQINGAADDSDDMDGGGYGSVDIAEILSAEVLRLQKALAQPEGCQCPECQIKPHTSDCAVHNEPAYPKGRCDCGAQPEQEPVGRFAKFTDNIWREVTDGSAGVPLYTVPPQRQWVGLTEWEREAIAHACGAMSAEWLVFVEAVEKALKEKNR